MAVNVPISAIQFDAETQPRVRIDLVVVKEYANAMTGGAEFPPVTLFRDGDDLYWIGDGFHRCQAARDLGLSEISADVTPGAKRDAIFASLNANGEHGLQRKNEDKQRSVRIMLEDEEWSQWGNREIARQCGVGESMVRTHKASICVINADSEQGETLVERGGTVYSMDTTNIGEGLTDEARERIAGDEARWDEIRQNRKDMEKLEKLDADQQVPVLNLMAEEDKSVSEAMKQTGVAWQSIHSSESNEWYTPEEYVEAARVVLGGIDVDPASNDAAQLGVVKAGTYYTEDTDGLAHDWPGTVWLNPPWGGLQAKFVSKLVEQYAAGITTSAVVVVNAHSTDTEWFQPLWNHILCFTDHRINFYGTEGGGSTHGSVFVYLGKDWATFAAEFAQFGAIVSRHNDH